MNPADPTPANPRPPGVVAGAGGTRPVPPMAAGQGGGPGSDDHGAPVRLPPGARPSDAPPPADAVVTTETVGRDDSRRPDQDFPRPRPPGSLRPQPGPPPPGFGRGQRPYPGQPSYYYLDRVGLGALGALVVGVVLSDGRQVIENTGDRVVLLGPDGRYTIYRDDDAILRRPGSTLRTERFPDGSIRTVVLNPDGTEVVTVRDITGRVLSRRIYQAGGRQMVLFDDLRPEVPVIIADLPPLSVARPISVQGSDAALRARMASIRVQDELGRGFSLRQIREIPEIRKRAPEVDVANLSFDTGSAAIAPAQAERLSALGKFMAALLADNPGEVFLVEGHTDAVGSAADNLTLSDRRAESVALALTEYFGIPPENMVVQGYGESDPLVEADGPEPANRRVVVRVITALLNGPGAQ